MFEHDLVWFQIDVVNKPREKILLQATLKSKAMRQIPYTPTESSPC